MSPPAQAQRIVSPLPLKIITYSQLYLQPFGGAKHGDSKLEWHRLSSNSLFMFWTSMPLIWFLSVRKSINSSFQTTVYQPDPYVGNPLESSHFVLIYPPIPKSYPHPSKHHTDSQGNPLPDTAQDDYYPTRRNPLHPCHLLANNHSKGYQE